MVKTAEQAIAQGFVYQIIKVNHPGSILTVHRVSDPRTQIITSSDFFISLQEEEGDADNETDNDGVGVSKEQLRLTMLKMKLMRNRRTK